MALNLSSLRVLRYILSQELTLQGMAMGMNQSTNLTLICLGNMKQMSIMNIKVSSRLVHWKQH